MEGHVCCVFAALDGELVLGGEGLERGAEAK